MGRAISMNDTIYKYIIDHSLRDDPVMKELREETAKLPMAVMHWIRPRSFVPTLSSSISACPA